MRSRAGGPCGAIAALALLGCDLTSAPAHARIVLQPAQTYQTITGWEATAQAGQDEPGAEAFVPRVLDAAADLGITRLRLEVASGAEHARDTWSEWRRGEIDEAAYKCLRYATVNDNADAASIDPKGFRFAALDRAVETVIQPFKARLARRGERLHLNVNYVAFTKQICGDAADVHDDPEEYAEFVLATLSHLRDRHGLIADTWEIILEPDNTRSWSGTRIGRAVVAAARRLRAHGFQTRFVAPSCASTRRAASYFDEMIAVPGAVEHLAELSYHRYAGASAAALAALATRGPGRGVRTAMLEKIGATYAELHEDLAIGMVSSWQQFTLAYPERDNGAQYFVVARRGEAYDVQPGARTRYLAEYFRHVRPGAQRIGADSDVDVFAPLAFRNADGTLAVIVKASRGGALVVEGLPAGAYVVRTAVDAGTHASDIHSHTTGAFAASIAGPGVLAIVAAPRAPGEAQGGS